MQPEPRIGHIGTPVQPPERVVDAHSQIVRQIEYRNNLEETF